jgi:hypothetical protein
MLQPSRAAWIEIGGIVMRFFLAMVAALVIGIAFTSCKSQTCIVTATATGIGLRASYDPKTQMPLGELGYIHTAVAIVPTDRQADGEAVKESATSANSADVINEISFNNFFSFWNENGIYERIAVGKNAVNQPGAVALFAKNNSGNIDENTLKALNSIKAIPTVDGNKVDLKLKLLSAAPNEVAKSSVVEAMNIIDPSKQWTWKSILDSDLSVEVLQKLVNLTSK